MERLELIHDIIKENPAIRFNDVMRISNLKNGTLTHYINKLESEKKINVERTPRITRFYDISIPEKHALICKYLTRSTMKDMISLLLLHETLTFPQIKEMVNKSSATVSVCLNDLFKANIIEKKYDIPSNKYSLKNSTMIKNVIKIYFPNYIKNLAVNT